MSHQPDTPLNRLIVDRSPEDPGIDEARARARRLLAELPALKDLRYYPFSRYLKRRFGRRVYKVTTHAGFTCPNRDGRVAEGGCTYCVNDSFSPNTRGPETPITDQMLGGIEFYRQHYGAEKFIAYFQTFSNTYADVATLKRRYDEALEASDDIVGISIGTRPDCVPDDVLDLVESYSDRREVWLEYGLQSMHDETLARINRGHGLDAFVDAVARTCGRNIHICTHVILGLPGEDWRMMMETADLLSEIGGIESVKIHHLYVAGHTVMAEQYARGEIALLTWEDYVLLVCDFLERLDPCISLQRLVGDTTSPLLVAPVWAPGKAQTLQAFTAELRRRGTCQGARAGDVGRSAGRVFDRITGFTG